MKILRVRKANGEMQVFDEGKVLSSLERASVPEKQRRKILKHIRAQLYDGITTGEIYSHIFKDLKTFKPHLASKYSLKKAVMELGPSGFPFEKFVARILTYHGYATSLNQILPGKCVSHEVDVVAEKNNLKYMLECKHRKSMGSRTDIKIALYVYARFVDLRDSQGLSGGWLVTNTKATADAIAYSKCVGLKIISWDYPSDFSLRKLIEDSKLHPLTALNSISNSRRKLLLDKGLVLCRDISGEKKDIAKKILGKDFESIAKRSAEVCGLQFPS